MDSLTLSPENQARLEAEYGKECVECGGEGKCFREAGEGIKGWAGIRIKPDKQRLDCASCHGTGKALVEVTELFSCPWPPYAELTFKEIQSDSFAIFNLPVKDDGIISETTYPLPLSLGTHVVAEEWIQPEGFLSIQGQPLPMLVSKAVKILSDLGEEITMNRTHVSACGFGFRIQPPSTMPESVAAQCQWRLVVVDVGKVFYTLNWNREKVWHQTVRGYYERNEG